MRLVLFLLAAGSALAQHPNYDDDVKPIFRRYCLGCHSAGEMRSGLNLETYAGVMRGGSSGEAIKPGRASGSLLYLAVAHEGDGVPRMPQGGAKIADPAISTIRDWIQAGAFENASSKPKGVVAIATFQGSTLNKPLGAVAVPLNLPTVAPVSVVRPHPVTALALSPWAPVAAVAEHERIALYNVDTHAPMGELAFPEGIPYVLRFRRDGSMLLAGGGRGVQSGKVVLFDVRTGARVAVLGSELDVVLAADVSPDGSLVALGGPGRVVKVYQVATGKLVYSISKHTDWVTAIEFSPDGSKLATGDRSGALYLWEAPTGNILVALTEHKDGVNGISWRGDGLMLASAGEDGTLVIWNAVDGFPAATTPNAHAPKPPPGTFGKPPNGILSVQFLPDGRIATVGRDRMIKLWGIDGKQKAASKIYDAPLTKVGASADSKTLMAGDSAGNVIYWDGK